MSLTAICFHISYASTILMKKISAENVIKAYLSGVLAHKGRCGAILSDNGTKFKNKVLNQASNLLGIKSLFSNLFHSQGNVKDENVQNFLK